MNINKYTYLLTYTVVTLNSDYSVHFLIVYCLHVLIYL